MFQNLQFTTKHYNNSFSPGCVFVAAVVPPPNKLDPIVPPPNPPNPPKPPAVVVVVPKPPNKELCVVVPPNKLLVPNILGAEVVAPNVDPKRGAGADVVVVPPNRFVPVEGPPKRLVDCVGLVEPNRLVEVAGVEKKLGVVVEPPKRLGFDAAGAPKRPVPADEDEAPNVDPLIRKNSVFTSL